MKINLSKDVENSINTEVLSGHFASADEAVAEAWRAFIRQKPQVQPSAIQASIGAMRDAADELDEAVEHAMNPRQRPWRQSPDE